MDHIRMGRAYFLEAEGRKAVEVAAEVMGDLRCCSFGMPATTAQIAFARRLGIKGPFTIFVRDYDYTWAPGPDPKRLQIYRHLGSFDGTTLIPTTLGRCRNCHQPWPVYYDHEDGGHKVIAHHGDQPDVLCFGSCEPPRRFVTVMTMPAPVPTTHEAAAMSAA
jgi:hypothetical protein